MIRADGWVMKGCFGGALGVFEWPLKWVLLRFVKTICTRVRVKVGSKVGSN